MGHTKPNEACPCGSGRKFKKCCRDLPQAFPAAVALHQHGDLQGAARKYLSALEADPNHAEALHGLGVIAHQSQDSARAVDLLARAAELRPASANIHHSLGVALQPLGRWEESANALARAIHLQPGSIPSLQLLGAALHAMQRLEDAASCYENVLRIDPNNAEAHNNLGVMLQGVGRMEPAIEHFHRAITLNPKYAEAYNNLGAVHRLLGRLEESVRALEESLALKPRQTDALYNLGLARKALGQPDAAIAAFEAALEFDPSFEKARYFLQALKGDNVPTTMPAQLVTDLFDGYAERFDSHLQGTLEYCTPSLLREAVRGTGIEGPLEILDLGCGTGLVGAAFHDLAGGLHGVDLSPRMVAKARERGIYDALTVGDAVGALEREPRRYDMVIAADVLVYLGDLEGVFRSCRGALRNEGWFVFSTESPEGGEGFVLSPSGRFQHSRSYVVKIADEQGFAVRMAAQAPLRKEGTEQLMGDLYILRARL